VHARELLHGGGDVGALIRSRDRSASPLDAPEAWPEPLRIVVDLLLQSRFPTFVAWRAKLGFLCNDAYAGILGAKHPRARRRMSSAGPVSQAGDMLIA